MTMSEPTEDSVRAEVRAWLEANWTPELGLVEWLNRLADSGWGIVTAKQVSDADTGRRQVRQFQASPKKSIAEHDVYCSRA